MNELIESIRIFESTYLMSLFALVVFIVIAKIADIIITRIIKRLVKKSKNTLDDELIRILHKPVNITIVMMGFIIALNYLNSQDLIAFKINDIIYSALVIYWMLKLSMASKVIIFSLVAENSDEKGISKEIAPLINNIVKAIIILLAIYTLLKIWKVDITPLLASAGILSIAVAFAAKDTLANFFGGVSLYLDRPYKIGDYINIESGERGEVVTIGLRSTRIRTRDDLLISIPNSIIANSTIINESAPEPQFRMRLDISVVYGTDVDILEELLLDISHSHEEVLDIPEPRVRFREMGNLGLKYQLLCWTSQPADRGRISHELTKIIYKNFAEKDIQIPFPYIGLDASGNIKEY